MKKLPLYAAILLTFFVADANGQNYIGIDKDDVRALARRSGYYPDNMTTSRSFNYLKFVNSAGTRTMIVFFSEDDIASHVRLICDYSEYDFVIDSNNKDYKKKGKNRWEFSEGTDKYEVTLEEKEWYFVLRIKKKQMKNQVF